MIFHAILHEIVKYNQNAILLVATNPVDVLSHLSWKLSGFSAERVIGTGTLLDSARFRYFIGQQLNVNPRSVHAHIVGEHGDSELPVWSRTNIAGVPIDLPESARATIFENTRNAAYEIIQAKGATSYAIALSIDRICTAILRDEGAVLNVSTLLNDYHGISDVYMGVPSVVARDGVREVIDLQPTAAELEQLRASAQVLRDRIAAVESLHPDWF
ncbi:hypothetical protein GCM10025857_25170 [Alicyclobacillus contaminans]|nr:hypothetical protein GCM10025857_25170 [Alicyclobacillus contaminans]